MSHTKLHLGCGPVIKPDWINIDIVPAVGVFAHDLTSPLPFSDISIDTIYSEHFIEHLTLDQGIGLLKECRRVLKASGTFRISTPDIDEIVRCYQQNDLCRWASVGFCPESRCRLANEAMRSWGHQFIYNEEELVASLKAAGFENIARVAHDPVYESRPYCGDLIMQVSPTGVEPVLQPSQSCVRDRHTQGT